MNALRTSAAKAGVRLERKLRYEFAKLKAKVQLGTAFLSNYAPAVPIAAIPHQASAVDPPSALSTSEKRYGRKLNSTMALKFIYGI